MKKLFVLILAFSFFLNLGFVAAHGEEDFVQAEGIIKQKISCDDLAEGQLEILGDYYMEQMHPGELHEIMDERIGGEGSESLRQIHINIGRAFYCGEHGAMSGEMMGMMMGRGMMGNTYYERNMTGFGISGWIISILVILVLILLIVLLIKKIQKPGGRK